MSETSASSAITVKPWAFVPILYFMQAMPNFLVGEVSQVAYKDFGIPIASITAWTSILAMAWGWKMLWGPFVDLNRTKRWWTLSSQTWIAILMGLVAASAMLPNFFTISLVLLGIIAVLSATCDIATDGYYLLSLDKEQQAAYVGLTSTFFRLGRLFVTGALILLAGILQDQVLPKTEAGKSLTWTIVFGVAALVYAAGRFYLGRTLPKPERDVQPPADPEENKRNLGRLGVIFLLVASSYNGLSAIVRLTANALANSAKELPLLGDLKGWQISAEEIQKQLIVLGASAVVSTLAFRLTRKSVRGTPMGNAFATFFGQKGILAILFFMLFYRFGEAMIAKTAKLFLLDDIANGGMGFSKEVVGTIDGIFGVLGIIVGGLIGGLLVSRRGIRKSIWPLMAIMHLPNTLYVYAAAAHPPNWIVYVVPFIEQFGYGVGFAAYMVILQRIAQRGNFPTAHYAIGTGIGGLIIGVAGIVSGILQSNFGWLTLFTFAVIIAIPGVFSIFLVNPEDPAPATT